MKQGEVRWYTFQESDKRRPILIVTRNSAIRYLTLLLIAPITTTRRGIPSEVLLTEDDGLLTECAVNLDNLQTVQKAKIGSLITRLPATKMQKVCEAISFAVGCDLYEDV